MKIYIKEETEKPARLDRKELESAIIFGFKELCITNRNMKNVKLTFLFQDAVTSGLESIEFSETKDNGRNYIHIGLLTAFPDRNEYEIRINASRRFSKRTVLSTLWHEMTHLKQYVHGQLVCTLAHNVHMWEKKLVFTKELEYLDLPWEVDANEEATRILSAWKKQKRKNFKNLLLKYFLMIFPMMKID